MANLRSTAGDPPPPAGPVNRSADVLVVGAGVVGLSIALALRDRGAQVLVVERAGVAEGQSGIQPGGIRLQWGTTINCHLATESHAWWRTAEERLAAPVPLAFASCGYLFLAHSDAVLDRLRENVRTQNAAGVPSRVVSPAGAGDVGLLGEPLFPLALNSLAARVLARLAALTGDAAFARRAREILGAFGATWAAAGLDGACYAEAVAEVCCGTLQRPGGS